MLSKIWNWFKSKGWKYILFGIVGYIGHVALETLILTNVLAKLGLSIPILV